MPFALAGFVAIALLATPSVTVYVRAANPPSQPAAATATPGASPQKVATTTVVKVPFFSQFTDISAPRWQKVGCGITDLAMVIDYYTPNAVSVNTLLKKGVAAGAYDYNAGWIYQGLIDLSHGYGLDGSYYDLTGYDKPTAYAKLAALVKGGPVIVSVYYRFNTKSPIPHLIVVNGIDGDTVYYNDPATTSGTKRISADAFKTGWKKKAIVIRPAPYHALALRSL